MRGRLSPGFCWAVNGEPPSMRARSQNFGQTSRRDAGPAVFPESRTRELFTFVSGEPEDEGRPAKALECGEAPSV